MKNIHVFDKDGNDVFYVDESGAVCVADGYSAKILGNDVEVDARRFNSNSGLGSSPWLLTLLFLFMISGNTQSNDLDVITSALAELKKEKDEEKKDATSGDGAR